MTQGTQPPDPAPRSSLIPKLILTAVIFSLLTIAFSVWLIRAYVLQPTQTINLPAPAPPPARSSSGSTIPTFSGTVVDAQTHQPIDGFFALVGYKLSADQPTIIFDAQPVLARTKPFNAGQYQLTANDRLFPKTIWYVRVEARGYLPAVSTAQSGSAKINFELTPSKDMIGRVFGADGKPAANVSLAIAFAGSSNAVSVQNGKLLVNSATSATSAADGSFDLPPQTGDFIIAACSPDGYAEATQDDFARSTDLHLIPWARVEGRLLIGTKPEARTLVTLSSGSSTAWKPVVYAYANAVTDADGHFVLTSVRPGPVQISRMATMHSGPQNRENGATTLTTKTTIEPGKTTTINLGGTGRQVVGKVIIPAAVTSNDYYLIGEAIPTGNTPVIPQMPDRIKNASSAERTLWMQTFINSPGGGQYRPADPSASINWLEFGDNNSFQITNLPPGNYLYQVYIQAQYQMGSVRLAEGHSDFTIPPLAPGDLDQPLQIPDLTLTAVIPQPRVPAAAAAAARRPTGPLFSGKISDKLSLAPVSNFTAIAGYATTTGGPINYVAGAPLPTKSPDGTYRLNPSVTVPPNADWFVRIEADGYLPVVSAAQHASAKLDFELTPAPDITGHVFSSSGQPAANASLAIALPSATSTLTLRNQTIFDRVRPPLTAAADGTFRLPPQTGTFQIVASSADGYAQVTQDDIAASPDIHLLPWGRVEGRVMFGSKPAVAADIVAGSLLPVPTDKSSPPSVSFNLVAQTDANGNFAFPNVRPGPIRIFRRHYESLAPQYPQLSITALNQITRATIEPGKTLTANLGGNGRRVSLKLILPDSVTSSPHLITSTVTATPSTPTALVYNLEYTDQNTFHIDDVQPGSYQIQLEIRATSGGVQTLKAESTFTMPPITPDLIDQPLEISDINLAPK